MFTDMEDLVKQLEFYKKASENLQKQVDDYQKAFSRVFRHIDMSKWPSVEVFLPGQKLRKNCAVSDEFRDDLVWLWKIHNSKP